MVAAYSAKIASRFQIHMYNSSPRNSCPQYRCLAVKPNVEYSTDEGQPETLAGVLKVFFDSYNCALSLFRRYSCSIYELSLTREYCSVILISERYHLKPVPD
jgi:hypothetical protein